MRGLVYTEIAVQGAAHDLHSGLYGGAAPNAINGLATILAGLKDTATGQIQIQGFYDAVEPPTAEERAAWDRLPFDEGAYLRDEVGAPALAGEARFGVLERLWARPTLDVHGGDRWVHGRGLQDGDPGARHWPRSACAWSRGKTPRRSWRHSSAPFRICARRASRLPCARWAWAFRCACRRRRRPCARLLLRCRRLLARAPALTRMGGSIPVVETFLSAAGMPSVLAGFGLPDDNLHAPNEKFHLPNFFAAIRFSARFLEQYGAG